MNQIRHAVVTDSSRSVGVVVAVCLAVAGVSGCAGLGYSNRVLWRVTSPDGQIVAVCQEVPAFDGPGFDLRLERPDGGLRRQLYEIGDGDPCTEVVWSPDGRTLAVLSGQVARVRFVDIGWALDHPEVQTAHWSWRQVDLSTERARVEGSELRFVGPTTIELQVCPARSRGSSTSCGTDSLTQRFDIPVPIVTVPI
jgi:hypothetical protein